MEQFETSVSTVMSFLNEENFSASVISLHRLSKALNGDNKFISLDELTTVDDIANLLNPADSDGLLSIFPGEVLFKTEEVKHKDSDFFRGICILPTGAGKFKIGYDIICNEFPDNVHEEIIVEVS